MNGLHMEKIDLNDKIETAEVEDFLREFYLKYEKDVDYTLIIRDNKRIIATASKAGNVLKCFAVRDEFRGEGITATLLNALMDKLFEEGLYHSFIFTKPENIEIFTSLNYKVLYGVEKVVLLENGIYDINSYLDKLIKKYDIDINKPKSSIVMNCNPFTEGHKYLIEEASKYSEQVLVFIVEENKSLFPFSVRYDLVKRGTEHLNNVKIIPGGEYIISSATFPSYFLKKEDDKLNIYTNLDAGIFGKYFCSKLNIDKRFVGEEPYCKVTDSYNNALSYQLNKFDVSLFKIPRKIYEKEPISASMVRNLIKQDKLDKVKSMVPEITWNFLNSEKGKEIVEIIKSN